MTKKFQCVGETSSLKLIFRLVLEGGDFGGKVSWNL